MAKKAIAINVQCGTTLEMAVNERMILDIRQAWAPEDAATFYDSRIRMIERFHRNSYIEQGIILNEMSEQRLYCYIVDPNTHERFTSFDRWLSDAAPISRSGGYAAMKALRDLGDVSVEQLRQMPRCNVEVMRGLSPAVRRDPQIIAAAQNQPEKEFVRQIQEKYPDQHVEPRRTMLATLSDSSNSAMEECFAVVRWVYDVEQREDVLELLFAYFMDGRCEREGCSDFSNREAFDVAKERGVA